MVRWEIDESLMCWRGHGFSREEAVQGEHLVSAALWSVVNLTKVGSKIGVDHVGSDSLVL